MKPRLQLVDDRYMLVLEQEKQFKFYLDLADRYRARGEDRAADAAVSTAAQILTEIRKLRGGNN